MKATRIRAAAFRPRPWMNSVRIDVLACVLALALSVIVALLAGSAAIAAAESGHRIFLPSIAVDCEADGRCCLSGTEEEPNNGYVSAPTRPPLCEGRTISGSLMNGGDHHDVFEIRPSSSGEVLVELDLGALPDHVIYDLGVEHLCKPNPKEYCRIATNDSLDRLKQIRVRLNRGDLYYLFVYRRDGASPNSYQLRWRTKRAPKLLWPLDEQVVPAELRPLALRWDAVTGEGYEVKLHNYDDRHDTDELLFTNGESQLALPSRPDGEYWWKVRAIGEGAFGDWSGEYMFYLCSSDLIHNIRAKSGRRLIACRLHEDNAYYIDRDYRVAGLSNGLTGLTWIRTANADSGATDEVFLSFDVSEPVELFIAYDGRATAFPNWLLRDFEPRPELQVKTDEEASPLVVFAKSFPAGRITLGGNSAAGAAGAGSNYVVLARRR
jgi:hypothetical protein